MANFTETTTPPTWPSVQILESADPILGARPGDSASTGEGREANKQARDLVMRSRRLLSRMPSQTRNSVVGGPVGANGMPGYLVTGSPTTDADVIGPVLLNFAAGQNAQGAIDYLVEYTGPASIDLTTTGDYWLFAKYSGTAVTFEAVANDVTKKAYVVGNTAPTTGLQNGTYFFNTATGKMNRYSGSAWVEVMAVFLGFGMNDGGAYGVRVMPMAYCAGPYSTNPLDLWCTFTTNHLLAIENPNPMALMPGQEGLAGLPVAASMRYVHATTAYTVGAGGLVIESSSGLSIMTFSADILTTAANVAAFGVVEQDSGEFPVRQLASPVVLTTGSGTAPTTGDGSLVVRLQGHYF